MILSVLLEIPATGFVKCTVWACITRKEQQSLLKALKSKYPKNWTASENAEGMGIVSPCV
jgi:hypothetical protein